MIKFIGIALVAVALAGCAKKAEQTTPIGEYTVDRLFTVDRCTVYRFYDGAYRYFTNCKGQVEWKENCGKSCQRDMNISGGGN